MFYRNTKCYHFELTQMVFKIKNLTYLSIELNKIFFNYEYFFLNTIKKIIVSIQLD